MKSFGSDSASCLTTNSHRLMKFFEQDFLWRPEKQIGRSWLFFEQSLYRVTSSTAEAGWTKFKFFEIDYAPNFSFCSLYLVHITCKCSVFFVRSCDLERWGEYQYFRIQYRECIDGSATILGYFSKFLGRSIIVRTKCKFAFIYPRTTISNPCNENYLVTPIIN